MTCTLNNLGLNEPDSAVENSVPDICNTACTYCQFVGLSSHSVISFYTWTESPSVPGIQSMLLNSSSQAQWKHCLCLISFFYWSLPTPILPPYSFAHTYSLKQTEDATTSCFFWHLFTPGTCLGELLKLHKTSSC